MEALVTVIFWYHIYENWTFFTDILARKVDFLNVSGPMGGLKTPLNPPVGLAPIILVKILSFMCILKKKATIKFNMIAKNHPGLHIEKFEYFAFQGLHTNVYKSGADPGILIRGGHNFGWTDRCSLEVKEVRVE